MNAFKRISVLYKKLTTDYLIVYQSLQTGTLMASGDIIAQTWVEKKNVKQIDFRRTSQFFFLGIVFVGPTLSVWYKFLSRTIGDTGSGRVTVVKKLALDQLVFAPCLIFVYLGVLNTVQGHGLERIKEEIRSKYTDILSANYKVWPAVQLFNFGFVPLRHQVLLAQSVALFWNAYLSWKTQQAIK